MFSLRVLFHCARLNSHRTSKWTFNNTYGHGKLLYKHFRNIQKKKKKKNKLCNVLFACGSDAWNTLIRSLHKRAIANAIRGGMNATLAYFESTYMRDKCGFVKMFSHFKLIQRATCFFFSLTVFFFTPHWIDSRWQIGDDENRAVVQWFNTAESIFRISENLTEITSCLKLLLTNRIAATTATTTQNITKKYWKTKKSIGNVRLYMF